MRTNSIHLRLALWLLAATAFSGCSNDALVEPIAAREGVIYIQYVTPRPGAGGGYYPDDIGRVIRMTPDSVELSAFNAWLAARPANGMVLFAIEDSSGLFMGRSDSTAVRKITALSTGEARPALSRDATLVAIIVTDESTIDRNDGRLVLIDTRTGVHREVATGAANTTILSISPNNRFVAFAGVDRRLYVVDASTGDSWSPGFYEDPATTFLRGRILLSWSPDSRSIAMSRRGSGVMIFSASARTPNAPAKRGADGESPTWSPVGRRIAYLGRDFQIVTMAPDSSERRVYDLSGNWNAASTGQGWGAEWSPDGTRLLYGSISGDACILDLASGVARRLHPAGGAYWADE